MSPPPGALPQFWQAHRVSRLHAAQDKSSSSLPRGATCVRPRSGFSYELVGRTTRLETDGKLRTLVSLRRASRGILHLTCAIRMESSHLHLHVLPSSRLVRHQRSERQHEGLRARRILPPTLSIWHSHRRMPPLLSLRHVDGRSVRFRWWTRGRC